MSIFQINIGDQACVLANAFNSTIGSEHILEKRDRGLYEYVGGYVGSGGYNGRDNNPDNEWNAAYHDVRKYFREVGGKMFAPVDYSFDTSRVTASDDELELLACTICQSLAQLFHQQSEARRTYLGGFQLVHTADDSTSYFVNEFLIPKLREAVGNDVVIWTFSMFGGWGSRGSSDYAAIQSLHTLSENVDLCHVLDGTAPSEHLVKYMSHVTAPLRNGGARFSLKRLIKTLTPFDKQVFCMGYMIHANDAKNMVTKELNDVLRRRGKKLVDMFPSVPVDRKKRDIPLVGAGVLVVRTSNMERNVNYVEMREKIDSSQSLADMDAIMMCDGACLEGSANSGQFALITNDCSRAAGLIKRYLDRLGLDSNGGHYCRVDGERIAIDSDIYTSLEELASFVKKNIANEHRMFAVQ